MKVSGKGVVVLIVLLVVFPLLLDLLFLNILSGKTKISMSGFLLKGYALAVPAYIVYLIIAIIVIRLFDKYIKRY